MRYQIFVDKEALPGGENAGMPPIIVRRFEDRAEGRVYLGRDKFWRVQIDGPSTVVSDLSGDAPHVWVECDDVTPLPQS